MASYKVLDPAKNGKPRIKITVKLGYNEETGKRIRKYNGMLIIITQNIKDFVGSEEIAQQSTAVINACQYSIIMSNLLL